jgi:N-acetylmuramoyl-L-alanine amidase
MAFRSRLQGSRAAAVLLTVALLAACRTVPPTAAAVTPPVSKPAPPAAPGADEIVVAGRRFATGTRIVTWSEERSYNAYAGKTPTFSRRMFDGKKPGSPAPDLAGLQRGIDQFVLHYDGSGLSKLCFEALQQRGLSVHFLLDVDGTVYQTLDLQEQAWHATTANERSIGIEIANPGAYPPGDMKRLTEWYQRNAAGQIRLTPPLTVGNPRIRTPNFTARPLRPDPVRGVVQGRELVQYDLTPEQYAALIKLTAALHRVFPKLRLDYPHDARGRLITRKLPDKALVRYTGVLGHFHIQENKFDPGPALQWDTLIKGAQREAKGKPVRPSGQTKGPP